MSCWGWATWENRWKFYQKDVDTLTSNFSKKDIQKFDLDNTANFWDQVMENKTGIINTWAVFWYATIFQKKGLCVAPQFSYVRKKDLMVLVLTQGIITN